MFVLMMVSFAVKTLFNFMLSHQFILGASLCTVGALFRKFLPESLSCSVFPMVSSSSFSISDFKLRSSFCTGRKMGIQFQSSVGVYQFFLTLFVE